MKSHLDHIQVNIDYKNIAFYKELMAFLGWSIILEFDGGIGFTSGSGASVWYLNSQKQDRSDYDKFGTNHIGIGVSEQKNVDEATEFITKHNISPLFETPRHRAEFSAGETETYYQVMFESPDKILFEIMYTGKKE